jgi:hypothetical protein
MADSLRLAPDFPRFAPLPEWLIYHPEAARCPRIVVVYGCLQRHADQGGTCFPGISRVAELLHVDRTSVIRSLRRLEAIGAVTVTSRYTDDGRQTSNLYTVHFAPKCFVAGFVPDEGEDDMGVRGGEGGTNAMGEGGTNAMGEGGTNAMDTMASTPPERKPKERKPEGTKSVSAEAKTRPPSDFELAWERWAAGERLDPCCEGLTPHEQSLIVWAAFLKRLKAGNHETSTLSEPKIRAGIVKRMLNAKRPDGTQPYLPSEVATALLRAWEQQRPMTLDVIRGLIASPERPQRQRNDIVTEDDLDNAKRERERILAMLPAHRRVAAS